MKHKICIFNDRIHPMRVTIQNCNTEDTVELIYPHQYKFLEVTVKNDQVPYFKVWETGQALLSGIYANLGEKK